jgi:tRNA(adenine34) deaminase
MKGRLLKFAAVELPRDNYRGKRVKGEKGKRVKDETIDFISLFPSFPLPLLPLLNVSHNRMEIDNQYMGEALAQAREAQAAGEVPVGAVLLGEGGEVLARAYNRPIGLNYPTAHAEVLALRQAAARLGNYRLPGTTLYVTIEPCIMCVGALIQARVSRLVFGAPDPKGGACVSLYRLPEDTRLNHRLEVRGGVREAECRELLQEFFKARR